MDTLKNITAETDSVSIPDNKDLRCSEMVTLTDEIIANKKVDTIFEMIYLAYKLGYKRGKAYNE